jgi:hypothetical protein
LLPLLRVLLRVLRLMDNLHLLLSQLELLLMLLLLLLQRQGVAAGTRTCSTHVHVGAQQSQLNVSEWKWDGCDWDGLGHTRWKVEAWWEGSIAAYSFINLKTRTPQLVVVFAPIQFDPIPS